MKIEINGNPKEIADLVSLLQNRLLESNKDGDSLLKTLENLMECQKKHTKSSRSNKGWY